MRMLLSRLAFCAGIGLLSGWSATAQIARENAPFFDLSRKPERVELGANRVIRFLTDDDYPPFHFVAPDGQLTGFNVDLARALCQELKAACTIQARRWDTLIPSLEENRGDAVIASLTANGTARRRVDFSLPYYRTPARFVARKELVAGKDLAGDGTSPQALKGRTVGVVSASAHAAFLTAFFPQVIQKSFPDQDEVQRALAGGTIDIAFADGIGLAVWLNGQTGAACCAFIGGPFYESRFFGEGATIAFRKDSVQMRRAVDHALYRLAENGTYQNLLLKYFPVSFY
jgi:polar amino acid transport system substrate-binding protein